MCEVCSLTVLVVLNAMLERGLQSMLHSYNLYYKPCMFRNRCTKFWRKSMTVCQWNTKVWLIGLKFWHIVNGVWDRLKFNVFRVSPHASSVSHTCSSTVKGSVLYNRLHHYTLLQWLNSRCYTFTLLPFGTALLVREQPCSNLVSKWVCSGAIGCAVHFLWL